MDFEAELHSLERSERLTAERYDAEVESARDDLADLPRLWAGPLPPPEGEVRKCQGRIDENENHALVSRRRADHAAAGFLFLSEDEHRDADYMGKYQPLVSEGHRRGRVRHGAAIIANE
jgi:hypothetical protein